jgi:hypothetical protein
VKAAKEMEHGEQRTDGADGEPGERPD